MPDLSSRPTAAAPLEANAIPPANKQASRQKMLTFVGAVLVVSLIAFGVYWALFASHFVSTDNAYADAETAVVTPLISAPVSGDLVRETDTVKAGQTLVELDASDAKLAVAEAQADMTSAVANLTRARLDLSRRQALSSGGAVSGDELSTAQNAYATARASIAVAQSRLDLAKLALSRTIITSPIDGVVSNKNVHVGEQVAAGRPLMMIVPVTKVYVDANFKELQLRRVKPGQKATLEADIYGGKVVYHGTVKGLSGGTGAAFSLISAQNASGNWIKVVQRVPVRITLDPAEVAAHPLRVGMSMKAKIDLSPAD